MVANDEAANDPVQQSLMDMVVSDGVQTRYFTLQKTIDIIHKAAQRQKIFIVCKTPQDVLTLVKARYPSILSILVICISAKEKKQIHKTVSVDHSDIEAFRQLSQLGIPVKFAACQTKRVKILPIC